MIGRFVVRWLKRGGIAAFALAWVTTAASAADEFVLGPGDRLSVAVYKRPDLSGEFRVQPDGSLDLPYIDPVPVAGRTLSQAREALKESLRNQAAFLDPRVNIDLVEARPVYVAGEVRRPGVYAFQVGMTVQYAISAAGGLRALDFDEFNIRAEAGRQRERLRRSQEEYGVALLRGARARAEREGKSEIAVPDDIGKWLSDERMRESVAMENGVLKQRVAAYRGQKDSLDLQIKIFQEEIKALQDQLETKGRESDLVQKEAAYQDDLLAKGLTPRTGRTIELRRIVVQVEGEMRQIVSTQAKAKQEIARIQQAKLLLDNQRDAELATLLRESVESLANLHIVIDEARRLLADANETVPDPHTQDASAGDASLTITRISEGKRTILAASNTTALQPGDLIEVPKR